MSASLVAVLCCTVLLLGVHGYFLLGSLPLLVLAHDTPMDAWFVRSFFGVYYGAAVLVAAATAASLANAGLTTLALVAAGLAVLAALLRRLILGRMDRLRGRLEAGTPGAIRSFRRLHGSAILINLAQVILIIGCLVATSMRHRAAGPVQGASEPPQRVVGSPSIARPTASATSIPSTPADMIPPA